jgi:hypothetical protein
MRSNIGPPMPSFLMSASGVIAMRFESLQALPCLPAGVMREPQAFMGQLAQAWACFFFEPASGVTPLVEKQSGAAVEPST